jgi:predicted MFS family arabinose efflux permease
LVPLRILRMRTLVGGNVVIFAIGMAVDAVLFTLTLYAQHVLGYSAVQFGLMTAAMTVMSIVGAMVGQSLVNRLGLRTVATASLVLIGLGCVLLIGIRVDASYARDLLPGLLVFGPGMGAAFVASQIAALTGVADEESGLASGLVDTSFNIGSAVGIAIAATAAVSRTNSISGGGQLLAQTEGYRFALVITVAFAVFGLLGAILLMPRATRVAQPLS